MPDITPEMIAEVRDELRMRIWATCEEAAIDALVAFERAEAQPCRSIRPPCDPLDRFGVCSRCTALAAIIEEALHADPK